MLTSYAETGRSVPQEEMRPPIIYSVVAANSSPFVSVDINEAKRRYDMAVKDGIRDVVIYKTTPDGDVTKEVGKPYVCPTCNQIDRTNGANQ